MQNITGRVSFHARFQSSPALTGGCYGPKLSYLQNDAKVSILTRPYGRMLCGPGAAQAHHHEGFNPHPPLRADAMLRCSSATTMGASFNPHPPLRADAMGHGDDRFFIEHKFQSSPALTGGCYDARPEILPTVYVFQSSPALTGGCYVLSCCQERRHKGVSILTRPYGRMLCRSEGGRVMSVISFNPHPPLRADAMAMLHDHKPLP